MDADNYDEFGNYIGIVSIAFALLCGIVKGAFRNGFLFSSCSTHRLHHNSLQALRSIAKATRRSLKTNFPRKSCPKSQTKKLKLKKMLLFFTMIKSITSNLFHST